MPGKKTFLDQLDQDKEALSDAAKVFRIQNQALRAAINCPLVTRTRDDCLCCGNDECFKAWQAQNELWPEPYDPPEVRRQPMTTRPARRWQKPKQPAEPTLFGFNYDNKKESAA